MSSKMDLQVAIRFRYHLGIWSFRITSYQFSLGFVKRLLPSPHMGLSVLGWFSFIPPVSGQPEAPPSSLRSFCPKSSSHPSFEWVPIAWMECCFELAGLQCLLFISRHIGMSWSVLWHTLAVLKIQHKGRLTENLIDVLLVAWERQIQRKRKITQRPQQHRVQLHSLHHPLGGSGWASSSPLRSSSDTRDTTPEGACRWQLSHHAFLAEGIRATPWHCIWSPFQTARYFPCKQWAKKEIDVSMDQEGNSKPIWNQLWPRKWYNLAVMRLSQNYFQTEM